jgi:Fic family protein
MAMDKDKLLQYFQQHYLSRQEVLFKLPLNVSIDTFWPELLNRRKAGATILPLFNATGMPYWYVLTEKMISASERLCAEAMEQEECFDPYRAPMTSAMTEEMFFTSFVEGAQIPLQEAMDFLQRGTEPENIQEQMIWNNRHAWSGMIGSLYRPLDEGFVKSLAFMLTEEMDNCAENYRQTDQHPIAAMNSEPYEVPSAYSLPGRMTEYYAFLQSGSVHPLIKAAVGQAYILVARPFPEGNERLSRMISSAVLLRSGYDFFRDISISSVIAKESYRYYKCMQEILRTENGGDLTYFMEYYLDLLVRALDSKKERELRRMQENLARERVMAHEPLRASSASVPQAEAVLPDEEDEPLSDDTQRTAKPWPLQPADSFMEQVRRLKHSPKSVHREYPVKVQRMLDQGLFRFSVSQWSQVQGIARKDADYECRVLYQKGLTDRHSDVSPMEYSFRIISASGCSPEPEEESEVEAQQKEANESPPKITAAFEEKLKGFEQSKSDTRQRTAATVRALIGKGITSFARSEWAQYTGLSLEHAKDSCDAMIACGMIVNTTPHIRPALYQFNLNGILVPGRPTQALINQLKAMRQDKNNQRDCRIGTFLLEMIDQGQNTFTALDWANRFELTKTQYGNDIRRAVNLGFVTKKAVSEAGSGSHCSYQICNRPQESIRSENLTGMQKEYLSRLYEEFAENEFSVEDMARLMQTGGASAQFHLNNFAERGILNIHRRPGKAHLYIFAVTSEDHPECFAQIAGPMEVTEMEKKQGEVAMAVASTANLTATA